MAEYETKLRHQLVFGPAALVALGVMADAFHSYLSKANPPCGSDVLRVGKLNGLIANYNAYTRLGERPPCNPPDGQRQARARLAIGRPTAIVGT